MGRLTIESLLFSGLRTIEFCRLRVADTIVGCNESVFVVSGLAGRDRTIYVPTSVSRLVRRFVRETRPDFLRSQPVDPEQLKRWIAFLRNHKDVIAATDFFTAPTVSLRVLYGFFVIDHGRR